MASVGWFGQDMTVSEASSSLSGSESTFAEVIDFVGGMNVPSRLGGRLNATIPLVRLTISDRTLRMQPRFFASVMFTGFEVPLREIASAFPIRGTFMTAGVGFELSDGQLAYFWTLGDAARILAVVSQQGIVIEPESRPARGALSGQLGLLRNRGQGASPSLVAKTPCYSPLVLSLMPLFIVIGVAVCVGFALSGTTFGWFVAVIGAIGVVQSVAAWRRSRHHK